MGESKSTKTPTYEVDFGKTLLLIFSDYARTIQNLVMDFVEYFEKKGIVGWRGKCTSSEYVPYNYPDKEKVINFAKQNSLWHAHIGYPNWQNSKAGNYWSSNFVVHFKKVSEHKIILLSIGMHDPMIIPSADLCNEQ